MMKKLTFVLMGLTAALFPILLLLKVSWVLCVLVDLLLILTSFELMRDPKPNQGDWSSFIVLAIWGSLFVQSAWAIWA